jgi:hypothetical protein
MAPWALIVPQICALSKARRMRRINQVTEAEDQKYVNGKRKRKRRKAMQ